MVESEVHFFCIVRVAFDAFLRLGRVKECPAGLEPPTEAKKRRKANVKIRKNPQLRIITVLMIGLCRLYQIYILRSSTCVFVCLF